MTTKYWMGVAYKETDPLLKRLLKGGDIEAMQIHISRLKNTIKEQRATTHQTKRNSI